MKREYITPRSVVCPLEPGEMIAGAATGTVSIGGGGEGERNDGDFEDLSIGGNNGMWDSTPGTTSDEW
jgi:hypothetical protein